MKNVGVIGGGLIGASWAAIFSKSGFKVYVYDSHPTVFETYIERVKLFLEELKSIDKDINIISNIDKKIIGGIILQFGANLIDASIRNKILKLNNINKGVN